MAVDRMYRCDLCRDLHDPKDNKLLGIYWKAGNEIELRRCNAVEHHLCRRCIESIASLVSTHLFRDGTG